MAPASHSPDDDLHEIFHDRPYSRLSLPAPFTVGSTSTPLHIPTLQPHIVPVAKPTEKQKITGESAKIVSEVGVHIREDPYEFLRQLGHWASGTSWRGYTSHVGQRVFYETYSQEQLELVLHSKAVHDRVETLVAQRGGDPEKERTKLMKETERVAKSLIPTMDSVPALRAFGATVNNILVRIYDQGIHISPTEFSNLRRVALKAQEAKQLYLAVPHIIAGNNLDLPVVGKVLKNCGATWIKRSFGEDSVYGTVVQEYVELLLEQGHNLECFIEGTRSRTGKLLPPKLGILKYVLDAFIKGRASDVWICPISLQYDKVIETESYVNELLGNPKEKETLWGLIANSRILQLKNGRIDVRFQEPFSLKAFIEEEIRQRSSETMVINEQRILRDHSLKVTVLKALGYRILSGINKAAVIMPVSLVGTVMLTLRGRGVGKTELYRRVAWLTRAITDKGGRVADFSGMSLEDVVDRALVVMKDLIGTHQDVIEPTYFPAKRFELSFYRNQVIHLFVSEAILSTALYTRVKQGGAHKNQAIPFQEVIEKLDFLSRLLKYEFVYETEGLEANAKSTIERMVRDDIIEKQDDTIGLSNKERSIGRENFDFYCFLLWPFIETYWIACVSLFAFTPRRNAPKDHMFWVNEKDFRAQAQVFGKTLFYQGDVSYLEAINQATLSNAFDRLLQLGFVQSRRSRSGKSVPLLALSPEYFPTRTVDGNIAPQGQLWGFLERLGAFRREGKNRRDNSTVSTRVLALADRLEPVVIEQTPCHGPSATKL